MFVIYRRGLWSSDLVVRVPGHIQRPWVRFPAVPDYLRGSGSGTESRRNSSGFGLENREYGCGDLLR
jgi:hypothetical protein